MTKRFIGLLILALLNASALAHQHIDPLMARPQDDVENQNGKGIKVDRNGTTGVPCGSPAAAVANIPVTNRIVPGQNFSFRAYPTIAHPGHELVNIYAGNNPAQDSDFTPLELVSAVYTDANNVKTNKVIVNTMFNSTKLKRNQTGFTDLQKGCTGNKCIIDVVVKIPANIVCNPSCTIQYVEQMEENPNAPTFYKSCMDVTIAPTATPTPVVPTPTPTPDPGNGGTGGGNACDE